MPRSRLERGLLAVAAIIFAASFYVFARFTVDDAFISWAYGKNLAVHGEWAYCPHEFEPVEAYTSVAYAVLAAIPEALGIDVVLFFKLVSTALLFYLVRDRVAGARGFASIAAAVIVASPLFVLHLYSGLETVAFGVVVLAAIQALLDDRPRAAAVIATMSFFVRPEGFLLAGLCWIAAVSRSPTRRTLVTIAVCAFSIGAYLVFRLEHYGVLLPHSFYVKSRGSFEPVTFARGAWLLLPVVLMFRRGEGRSAANLAVAVLLVLGFAEVVMYAASKPMMNYGERFLFHLFVPVALFAVAPTNIAAIQANLRLGATATRVRIGGFLVVTMVWWAGRTEFAHWATYYPRNLDTHVALGRVLATSSDDSPALVFGDAGAVAYITGWEAIDNVGLASNAIAGGYFNVAFLERVQPEIVIFFSEPGTGLRLRDYRQETMWKLVVKRGYAYVCTATLYSNYELALYASPAFLAAHPAVGARLDEVCRVSRERNDRGNGDYLRETLARPPFAYWHL